MGMVTMRFPTLETRSLEGDAVRVPDDLPSNPSIVLLPFQRWHQDLIETWDGVLGELAREHPTLSVWEVPALSRLYVPSRFFIDGGMRAGIPSPDTRRHTLTAYTDLRVLARKLSLPGFDTLHV